MFRDYYEILEIDPEATNEEIKKAYRNLALEVHPDCHQDNHDDRNVEMSLINEAYSVLSDRSERSSYDVEWRSYYRKKGLVRSIKNSGISKNGAESKDLTRPVHFEAATPSERESFWKSNRFLIIVLVILIIILMLTTAGKIRHTWHPWHATPAHDFPVQLAPPR